MEFIGDIFPYISRKKREKLMVLLVHSLAFTFYFTKGLEFLQKSNLDKTPTVSFKQRGNIIYENNRPASELMGRYLKQIII
jgi:hypothetical protein